MSTSIQLACASDRNYMPHCAAMLHSALSHGAGHGFRIHYLHGPDVPAKSRELVAGMIERQGGTISFVEIPDERIDGLPITQHFSRAMWYRIHLPELLPNVERVLYLDADLIALDSLEPLWETDLKGNYVAAVTNVFGPWDVDYPAKLGLPSPESYFNTGVLLMDLDEMRADNCTTALRECALEHGEAFWFPDQDAMNVVLAGRRLPLHPRWNSMSALFTFSASVGIFGSDATDEARRRPAIRHFEGGGANKPWHYLCDQEMREVYFEHRRETPWPNVRLEGLTPANVLRRLTRRTRHRLPRSVGDRSS